MRKCNERVLYTKAIRLAHGGSRSVSRDPVVSLLRITEESRCLGMIQADPVVIGRYGGSLP